MNTLTDREWMYLSQSLFRMYQAESYDEFCDVFWVQIKRIIPCSSGVIFKIYLDGDKITRSCARAFPEGNKLSQIENFAKSNIVGSSHELLFAPWSSVFRQSDIYPLTEWESMDLYNDFWKIDNVYFGLNCTLIYNDRPVASITLFRSKNMSDFSEKDVKILELLKNHLALKIYQLNTLNETDKTESGRRHAIYDKASSFGLTKRETEIIMHLCSGEARADICKNLYISESTLRKHIYNIYSKLSVNTNSNLIIWANENLYNL